MSDWWQENKWEFVSKNTCKPMRFQTCNRCNGTINILRVYDHHRTCKLAFEGDDEDEELYILSNDLHLADTQCSSCNVKQLRWVKAVQE